MTEHHGAPQDTCGERADRHHRRGALHGVIGAFERLQGKPGGESSDD